MVNGSDPFFLNTRIPVQVLQRFPLYSTKTIYPATISDNDIFHELEPTNAIVVPKTWSVYSWRGREWFIPTKYP